MTDEKARNKAKILSKLLAAVAEGKTLQYKGFLENGERVDFPIDGNSSFSFSVLGHYRIKPEPQRFVLCKHSVSGRQFHICHCQDSDRCSDSILVEEVIE